MNFSTSQTAVVAATYQFFTGSIPNAGGFEYLIDSPANSHDLNDPYYASFNQENLFINFAGNLAAGSESYHSHYGSLSYEASVSKAYGEIFGYDEAAAAGVDVGSALAFFMDAQDYFETIATERFDLNTVSIGDAVKIVMIGSMLNESFNSGIGHYGEALDLFTSDVIDDGSSVTFGRDILDAVNEPPVALTSELTIAVSEGSEVTLNLNQFFDDPDAAFLFFGMDTSPDFVSLESTSLTIAPGYDDAGSYLVEIGGTDAVNVANLAMTINVVDSANEPTPEIVNVLGYSDFDFHSADGL